jgi:23S rRNA (adenine1618-N6)-methyltransferase
MNAKQEAPKEKSNLHPRSKHKERYDFDSLIKTCPELKGYVEPNKYGNESINFFDPEAVKTLNKALLMHFYEVKYWDIPKDYLTPPIPGRADYLHHVADLLADERKGKIPKGEQIQVLDIGVGANCIYPLVGHKLYGWSFVGSDIDSKAMNSAKNILSENRDFKNYISLRFNSNEQSIFDGIINKDERFDLVICNPPFHASKEEAMAGSRRKIKNLTSKKVKTPKLNFGGQSNELWCEGGEKRFMNSMIQESKKHSMSCFWFTSIVSNEDNLQNAYSSKNH